ncbi:AI-2E family transporter [Rhizosphaericola mali]|uniref:AI-2E family transporter n=1 Tax=Rhizosphaericola mali TaxID=2545455 RepID=A0A5P2G784_9BACT|nr:AI-2E family transporter [Rhizosphaericola mali]QES90119.1 AI-2E family transporter [Rhizosphaericola mali]
MESSKKSRNRITLLIILIILGGFLFYTLIQFFTAFLGALIFYVLSKSNMRKLTYKYGWNKSLAAILIMVISFFVILLPISLLSILMYNKAVPILQNPTQVLNAAKNLDATIYSKLHFSLLSAKTIDSIPAIGGRILGAVVNTGMTAVTSILMMYFFLYFMLTSMGRMEATLILFLPFERKKLMILGKELYAQTLSNSIGIPLIAIAQGLCGYIAYLIAGVPQAGFWGVITGFASVIPVVGAAIVWVPVAIYLLAMQHYWQAVTVVLICAIVLGSVDNVIRFALAKKMADVHPIITVLGVVMGLNYFGFTGLIFGPLLISYFFILLKFYYLDYLQKPQLLPEKPLETKKSFSIFQLKKLTFPKKKD